MTNDSNDTEKNNKEPSNDNARSVCVSSEEIEGLEESINNNIRITDLS